MFKFISGIYFKAGTHSTRKFNSYNLIWLETCYFLSYKHGQSMCSPHTSQPLEDSLPPPLLTKFMPQAKSHPSLRAASASLSSLRFSL